MNMHTRMTDHIRPGPASTIEARPLELVADDGYLLGARLFIARRPAVGTVVIHGATAVKQTYYAHFAAHLAEGGLNALTYDYRGIGDSRPASLRGLGATMTDWARLDARAALAHARALDPRGRVAFVGHSFGGQMIGLVDELRDTAGAVLVGSQLGWYGHWPAALDRARLSLTFRAMVPALTGMFGYWPGAVGLGTDLPAGVAREWARWCSHPDYLISDHPDARARFGRFDRPLLFYSFTDDDFAPEPAVTRLLDLMPGARAEHLRVAPQEIDLGPIGHFGYFRRRFREALWGGARDFLAAVLDGRAPEAPRPQSAWGVREEDLLSDLRFGRG